MYRLPMVAAVNDMSGFGRCSLTVAIPVLSAMGLQCCPLPTALLSNHTGYETYYFSDYTDSMESYYKEWLKLDLDFAAVYSGFLGSEKQVSIVMEIIRAFKEKQIAKNIDAPLAIIDPVMGDNGSVYATYNEEMCQKMRQLVSVADIITPNVTEAAILLNSDYQGEYISLEQGKKTAERLTELGPKIAVLTGVKTHDGKILNLAYQKDKREFVHTEYPLVYPHFNGTGDVFASVLCGALVNGMEIGAALEKAAEFVYVSAKFTAEKGGDVADGVLIEHFLHQL
ncbi:MAG: pyridoxamine kinase [Bacillota bacterium]|jgi:pyridoxine kinase